jgi:hypothetical protein
MTPNEGTVDDAPQCACVRACARPRWIYACMRICPLKHEGVQKHICAGTRTDLKAAHICAGTRHLCTVVDEQLCDLGTLRVLAERVQRRVVQVRTRGRLCADLQKVLGNRYTTYTCVH